MKRILIIFLSFGLFGLPAFSQGAATAPRILTLAESAPHPKALIQRLDLAAGIAIYQWLDAEGQALDSGGSLARFTPVTTDVAATDTTPAATVPADPGDAALAAAIVAVEAVVAPTIPDLTRRQLFLWLNTQGHTRAAIRAVLETIADATQREAALIEFDEAQGFKRSHPLIAQLGAALGYTSEQIDAGFVAAAQL